MAAPTFYIWVGLAYALFVLILAFFVFAIGPTRMTNRLLSAVLLLEAAGWTGFALSTGAEIGVFTLGGASRVAWYALNTGPLIGLIPVYLVFLAHAAPTQGTAWMRKTGVIAGAMVAALAIVAAAPALNDWATGLAAKWGLFTFFVLPYTIALGMAWTHLRQQEVGSAARGRAKLVFFAVLMRDIPWLVHTPAAFLVDEFSNVGHDVTTAWREILWAPFLVAFAVATVVGVLRGQLVDVDRKLHFTVSRTTIAAMFIAVFVGVQTLVSEFVTSAAGLAAGAVASGVLFFALSPLQGMAERVADKAVPHGRAGAQLSPDEAEAFYREQVQIAYSDGAMGAKERKALASVRSRLGLSAERALALEDRVVAAKAAGGHT